METVLALGVNPAAYKGVPDAVGGDAQDSGARLARWPVTARRPVDLGASHVETRLGYLPDAEIGPRTSAKSTVAVFPVQAGARSERRAPCAALRRRCPPPSRTTSAGSRSPCRDFRRGHRRAARRRPAALAGPRSAKILADPEPYRAGARAGGAMRADVERVGPLRTSSSTPGAGSRGTSAAKRFADPDRAPARVFSSKTTADLPAGRLGRARE